MSLHTATSALPELECCVAAPGFGIRTTPPPARIRSPGQELPIAGPAHQAHRTTPELGCSQATDSCPNRRAAHSRPADKPCRWSHSVMGQPRLDTYRADMDG